MKQSFKLMLLMLCCTFVPNSFAQKPEPVYSIIRQVKSFDWYEQQAKAWKQEIDKGNAQPMAWIYWYEANRMARQFCDQAKWESKQGDYFIQEKLMVERAEKAIPGTFELYYISMKYQIHVDFLGDKTNNFLFKAHEIRPFDNLILPNLLYYYLFQNDQTNLELVGKKWYERHEIPSDILSTAYNMLISLEPNSILLTYGDNDSYPLWVLQLAKNIRTDVLVLNLSFVRKNPSYQSRIFKTLGIASGDTVHTYQDLFRTLITKVTNRPIYVSAFAAQDVYVNYQKNMYLVGLSFKYSPKPFNNLEVMRNDVEKKFMLDFLKLSFSDDYAQSAVNGMNKAYINIFTKLHDYYKYSLKDTQKAESMLEMAKTVAKYTGDNEWLKILNK